MIKPPKAAEAVRESSIYVAGHNGMVGSSIVRRLQAIGVGNLLLRSSAELDLRDQGAVNAFFDAHPVSQVYLAAACVGGIHANNSYPGRFIYENLQIQSNVIHAAYRHGVTKLLFLGSSCIYPKLATQPMSEDALLTGSLEPTNEPYAIAKIAGIKMCESYNREYGTDYRSVMPTNLYGAGDNYHPENSHVVPGLLRRFHEGKVEGKESIVVWGSGRQRREFLHVDDMASACLHVMHLDKDTYARAVRPMCSHLNVGFGSDLSIAELAEMVARVVGYEGRVFFDQSKPDGAPQKLLDSGRMQRLGWQPELPLRQGLVLAYDDFLRRQVVAADLPRHVS